MIRHQAHYDAIYSNVNYNTIITMSFLRQNDFIAFEVIKRVTTTYLKVEYA